MTLAQCINQSIDIHFPIFDNVFLLKIDTRYVAQAIFKHLIILPQHPEFWDYKSLRQGLENWFRVWEHLMLLERPMVLFPALMLGNPQSPVTPTSGEPILSSGIYGTHVIIAHTCTHKHRKANKNRGKIKQKQVKSKVCATMPPVTS